MFLLLSKILSFLTAPTTWILILLSYGLFFKRQKWSKTALKIGVILSIILTNPLFSNLTFKAWEIEPIALKDLEKHDIALVYTGMTIPDKKPDDRIYFNKAADRIMMAVHLYKIGKVDRILISGGQGSVLTNYIPESERLNEFLLMLGIPKSDIIIENKANNTYENALYSKKVIDENYPNSKIILITSAFHMRRAMGCSDKAGLIYSPFACDYFTITDFRTPENIIIPDADALKKWDVLCHELVGYLIYWITGKI